MGYYERAVELKQETVDNRRYFHTNAEVGLDMPKAKAYVMQKLKGYGLEPQECGYGVTATLGSGDKCILLRADMDALPMPEESGEPFACPTGTEAHACGHDFHAAMLLTAAKMLKENEATLKGKVKFMFQPAEETFEGSKNMIENGILDGVDAALAYHVSPGKMPVGLFMYNNKSTMMFSVNGFKITIKGRGGHGAYPHYAVDPINIGVHIHLALQELMAREADPAKANVLTVGNFSAGTVANIIPETAVLQGTLRTNDPAEREKLVRRLTEVVTKTAEKFNGTAEIEMISDVPPLICDPNFTNEMVGYMQELPIPGLTPYPGVEASASEDFAVISEKVPSAFMYLSAGYLDERGAYGAHNPKAQFNEDVCPMGAACLAHCATRWLEGGNAEDTKADNKDVAEKKEDVQKTDVKPDKEKKTMAENQATPQVASPLAPKAKKAVELGGMMYMLFVAFAGLSLAMIQSPVLTSMNGMQYFSTTTILASLGLAIMTPVGGKLGGMYGRQKVMVLSGIFAAVCCIGLGLSMVMKSVVLFMVFRFLLGAAQGLFTASPYIILGEINEPKDVPKGMGLLTTVITVGGFAGSILAGILVDAGQLLLAVVFPILPLAIGIFLIAKNLPNKAAATKPVIDIKGVVALAVLLTGFLFSLNLGAQMGWTNPVILGLFVVAIVGAVAFIKVEQAAGPIAIVPVRLFSNKKLVIILIVGWLTYFYQTAMNTYIPLALLNVIQAPATLTGMLQLPRTAFSMFVPVMAGTWVGKKTGRRWQAMAIAMVCYIVTFAPMCLTSPAMPAILYIVLLALTGIGDGYKSVVMTPSAQASVEPQDMGIATALVTFFNSTASPIAAALMGVVYDTFTKGSTEVAAVQAGVNGVFVLTTVSVVVGLVLVLLFVRKSEVKAA